MFPVHPTAHHRGVACFPLHERHDVYHRQVKKSHTEYVHAMTVFNWCAAGMFPYVCAAMLPVFFSPTVTSKMLRNSVKTGQSDCSQKSKPTVYRPPTRIKQNAITVCLCAYTVLQLFLPYSHFITQV